MTFFSELAFLAAVPVAAAAGLTGYFLALRGQVFTADALGHTAYTGAFAALLAGIDLRAGLFAATVSAAVLMGVLGRRGQPDDVVVGSLFAWILGLGAFFQAIYTSGESTGRGNAGVTVLFGSIFGISAAQAWVAAIISIVISLAVLLIARPLLFASFDEATAAAKGVPVRLVGLGFLALVGACAAEAAQVVGALLLLGLLAAPGGAARLLTIRPYHGLALAAGLAIGEVSAGLALSLAVPTIPPSFAIMAVAALVYAGAATFHAARLRDRWRLKAGSRELITRQHAATPGQGPGAHGY